MALRAAASALPRGILRQRRVRLLAAFSSGTPPSLRERLGHFDGPRDGSGDDFIGLTEPHESQPSWDQPYVQPNAPPARRSEKKLKAPHFYFRYMMYDLYREDPNQWTPDALSQKFRMPANEVRGILKLVAFEDHVMSQPYDESDPEAVRLHEEDVAEMAKHRSGFYIKQDGVRMPAKSKPIVEEDDDEGGLLRPLYTLRKETDKTPEFDGELRMVNKEQRHKKYLPPPDEVVKGAPDGWSVLSYQKLHNRIDKGAIKGRTKRLRLKRQSKLRKMGGAQPA